MNACMNALLTNNMVDVVRILKKGFALSIDTLYFAKYGVPMLRVDTRSRPFFSL